jgi:triosephosphate isomerase
MIKEQNRKKTAPKLIVANWKMNPDNLRDAKKIFADLKKKNLKKVSTSIVICPPVLYLNDLAGNYRGDKFKFGVQDISFSDDDKSTGEVSAQMLKNTGVRFAIVGHSEQRELGQTNDAVARKAMHAISNKIVPIVCVGERERDEMGDYLHFIKEELHESLEGIPKNKAHHIVIAYEPIWAIGKGNHAISPHELHQIVIFIRKNLASMFGRKVAMKVPILYGGSVDADNCAEIVNDGAVNGLLVGRASLNPHLFADILKAF